MYLYTFPSAQLKHVGYKTLAIMVRLSSCCGSTIYNFFKLVYLQRKFTTVFLRYLCIFPQNFRSILKNLPSYWFFNRATWLLSTMLLLSAAGNGLFQVIWVQRVLASHSITFFVLGLLQSSCTRLFVLYNCILPGDSRQIDQVLF